MTESEWMASEDPAAMLRFVRDPAHAGIAGQPYISVRKLRLFACVCCRLHWAELVKLKEARRAVLNAEEHVEGLCSADYLARAMNLVGGAVDNLTALESMAACASSHDIHRGAKEVLRYSTEFGRKAEEAAILRDIVGDPFRPVTLPPGPSRKCWSCDGYGSHMGHGPDRGNPTCDTCDGEGTLSGPCPWITPQVVSLAQAAYDERGRTCPTCKGYGRVPQEGDGHPTWIICQTCHGIGTIDDGTLDPFRLALLSDALEQEGCPQEVPCRHCGGTGWDPDKMVNILAFCDRCQKRRGLWDVGSGRVAHPLLAHLRSPGPHYRGMWSLDLILGRE